MSMACHPCHTPHAWSTEAYTRRVTGWGLSYRERLCQRLYCPEYRVNLVARLLAAHRQRQHRVGHSEATPLPPRQGGGRFRDRTPAQYRVSLLAVLARLRCPLEGCQGAASSRTNLWVQFSYQHPLDSIFILEEGNQPPPICAYVSSTTNLLRFLSVLRWKIYEFGCAQLRASCGTNMPHWGHRGWG